MQSKISDISTIKYRNIQNGDFSDTVRKLKDEIAALDLSKKALASSKDNQIAQYEKEMFELKKEVLRLKMLLSDTRTYLLIDKSSDKTKISTVIEKLGTGEVGL